jgi:hypothetical protein
MATARARSQSAILSVAVLSWIVLLAALAQGCGGEVAPDEGGERHVSIVFRSEKQNGREIGLPWLEPAIARADAQAMVAAFAWEKTAPLRELDADGAPALYYAAVYLRSREEVGVLDQVGIHHSFMPLFEHEQRKWDGQKGRMSQSTDGKGALLFAVVPGRIYNEIRKWALAGDPLVSAIILRDVPKEAQNAQGSLSYDFLVASRFKYRGMEPIRPSASGENAGTSQQKLVILTARLALKAVAEAAEEIPRAIARAAGDRDRNGLIFGWGAAGTITLRLTLDVHDVDPAFADASMVRAWGKDLGTPVMLPGVRVSVWSRGDATVAYLPTLFEGTTNAASMATIKMAKNRAVRSLCVATENDAAEITDLLTEIEVCDFEGSVDKSIDNLKFDTWANVTISDPYFNILAQATEARAYLTDVVGYSPHKATIVVGWIADAMGLVGTGAPFAPCLGFPNASADLIVLPVLGFIAAVPVVGPPLAAALAAATPLMAADIFFPEGDALTSRGAPTHEYGHFAMCSMLYDSSVFRITTAWTSAVVDRIGGGAVPGPIASKAYDIEAFADFFAGQVVGGTNYFAPGLARTSGMSYCDVNATPPDDCLDENFSSEATFFDQVARVATTMHDAFDGDRYNSSFTNQPGNGNVWTRASSVDPLVFAGTSRNGDKHDEEVLLPGAALRTFVGKLDDLNGTKFMTSLADTIRENGYDWCQTCRVFALHAGVDPQTQPPAAFYAKCAQAPISTWVGAAPDANDPTSCNFGECPYPLTLQYGPNGLVCAPCAANQIWVNPTTCATCPPGTQVVNNQCMTCTTGGTCTPACPERQHFENGACVDCPFSQVSVDGVCQDCPPGMYRYHNTCVTDCPPELDETIIVDGVCTYILK